jgi:UDP-N-acetylglucosamine acyltransferase
LYTSGLTLAEAREQLAAQAQDSEDVRAMLEFLDRSERGLAR